MFSYLFFFFNDTATTEIYTLSLHDALPISIDLPAGAIKSGGGEILIRTKGKRYKGPEYAGITILENIDGTELKVGDIAEVRDTFRETDEYARFGGLPAAMVAVYRVGEQKPLEISGIVKKYVEQKRHSMPDSIKLSIWNDFTEYYRRRFKWFLKNAFLGLLLSFLALGYSWQYRFEWGGGRCREEG